MFGVYNILETIGQGGMGVVYRAHDTSLDRVVALKVLKEDLRGSKQVAARFQREAQAFASLNHPNIVHIYSVGSVGRIPYFAMELIEGAPLSRIMKRDKRIDWERALHIAQQIAEALSSAHDAHIIHRDIKPGNILVNADDRAYVTDFGIAKVLTAETQLTVEGSRLGTPQYMSPERCMNREITPVSDLYSLGVLLFQMISGRLPYESSSPVELIKKIVSDPPARLSDHVPDIPEDVERLVAYLIEKKPEDRPQSAREVANLCRRVIEGEPLFEDSGAASTLRDFREGLSTPTPGSTSHSGLDSGSISSHLEPLRQRWNRLSGTARVWLIGAGAVVVAAAMGQLFARQANEGYALDVVRRWDRSTAQWTLSALPAEFIPESAGVTLVRMNMPLFSPGRLIAAGTSGFAVELHGWEDSARAGHAGIAAVAPLEQRVRLVVTPVRSPDTLPLDILGADQAGSPAFADIDAVFFARHFGDWRGESQPALYMADARLKKEHYGRPVVSLSDLSKAAGRDIARLGPVAVAASRRQFVMAAGGPAGWQLFRVTLNSRARPTAIEAVTEPGLEVHQAAYSEDGGILFMHAASESGGLVFRRLGADDGAAEPAVLWEGGPGTVSLDLAEHGALVILPAETPESETQLAAIDVTGGVTDFGPAASAAFHPNGGVVFSDRDRRGNLQLWTSDLAHPEERRQLTFLAMGLRAQVCVSQDGRHALGVVADEGLPRLVLVDLAEAGREPF